MLSFLFVIKCIFYFNVSIYICVIFYGVKKKKKNRLFGVLDFFIFSVMRIISYWLLFRLYIYYFKEKWFVGERMGLL